MLARSGQFHPVQLLGYVNALGSVLVVPEFDLLDCDVVTGLLHKILTWAADSREFVQWLPKIRSEVLNFVFMYAERVLNAGSKMGKSGLVASDWHHHPIVFERSIRVTQSARCLNETRCASAPIPANGYPGLGCVAGTAIVQGHEQSTRPPKRSR